MLEAIYRQPSHAAVQSTCPCAMLLRRIPCGNAGGQGQYGRVVGYMEPLARGRSLRSSSLRKRLSGNAIPPSFIPACEKGFREACNSGGLTGHPVQVSLPHQSLWYEMSLFLDQKAYIDFNSRAVQCVCDHFAGCAA